MADWLVLALSHGGVLSVALGIIIVLSLWVAPDAWISDYPPDIRQRYGEMSDRGRRLRPLVAGAFFGSTLALLLLASLRLRATASHSLTYFEFWRVQFIMLMTFNLFDLLILDWLLFVGLQPQRLVLPGTAGMAGYRDFTFHLRGFLVGIVFSAVASALFAALAVLIQPLLGRG